MLVRRSSTRRAARRSASYQLAVVVFTSFHHLELRFFTDRFDWGLPLAVVAILVTFVWLGLYKLEAFVSRPLHLFTLLKGTLVALVITAFFVFTFKSPVVERVAAHRVHRLRRLLRGLGRRAHRAARQALRRPTCARAAAASLVIGASADSSVIASRCRELRGFAPVRGDRAAGQAPQRLRRRAGAAARAGRRRAGAAPGVPGRRLRRPQGDLRPHRRGSRPRRRGVRHRPAGEPARHHAAAHAPLRDAGDARAPRPGRRRGHAARASAPSTSSPSAAALVLLSPVFAVIAILVKRSSPRPGLLPPDARRPARQALRVPQVPLDDRGQRRRRAPRLRVQAHRGWGGRRRRWPLLRGRVRAPRLQARRGRARHAASAASCASTRSTSCRSSGTSSGRHEHGRARGRRSTTRSRPTSPGTAAGSRSRPASPASGRSPGAPASASTRWSSRTSSTATTSRLLTDISLCLRTVPAMLVGRGAV